MIPPFVLSEFPDGVLAGCGHEGCHRQCSPGLLLTDTLLQSDGVLQDIAQLLVRADLLLELMSSQEKQAVSQMQASETSSQPGKVKSGSPWSTRFPITVFSPAACSTHPQCRWRHCTGYKMLAQLLEPALVFLPSTCHYSNLHDVPASRPVLRRLHPAGGRPAGLSPAGKGQSALHPVPGQPCQLAAPAAAAAWPGLCSLGHAHCALVASSSAARGSAACQQPAPGPQIGSGCSGRAGFLGVPVPACAHQRSGRAASPPQLSPQVQTQLGLLATSMLSRPGPA